MIPCYLLGKHCGAVVQLGGTRALLNLFNNNSKEGKTIAAHAIAKIAIKMDPSLAFAGQRFRFHYFLRR